MAGRFIITIIYNIVIVIISNIIIIIINRVVPESNWQFGSDFQALDNEIGVTGSRIQVKFFLEYVEL